ncbi:unnamed protein product [Trichobilharzia regenti]|nr:unnamed protein product [Trichobilharzia regenti]
MLDYLLDWKTENENLIFFEERQDMYGLFESPKVSVTRGARIFLLVITTYFFH